MHLGSFLDAKNLAELSYWAEDLRAADLEPGFLIARYISAPAAEQLIDSHISFCDAVGNYHLELGERYNWTRLGIRNKLPERQAIGRDRVEVQLLLQFASDPSSLAWTVRRIAEGAGVSKSAAALMLRRLDPEEERGDEAQHTQIMDEERVRTALLGYGRVVRPKVLVGRFRPPKNSLSDVLEPLGRLQEGDVGRFAITGRAAAQLLGHKESLDEVPLFAADWHGFALHLKLQPDPKGQIVLLRAFGSVVYGKSAEGFVVSPIPLIIAELLTSKAQKDKKLAETMWKDFLAREMG